MSQLLDLETKLLILANNPCWCVVCTKAARFAKHALAGVSPSGAVLLEMSREDPGFRAAEQKFRDDEAARLQDAYDTIRHGRCMMVPPPSMPVEPIPELPDPDQFRERIEHYRKHQMKPRMTHRRGRIEMKQNPRMPGVYIIK